MIKYKFLIGLLLIVSMASAQNFDQNKMNRDLEVARTVLNSLVNKSGVNWVSNDNKGRYIEGYGVILNMPPHNLIFGNFDFPVEDFDFHFDNEDFEFEFEDEFDNNAEIIIADGKRLEDEAERVQKEAEDIQKDAERLQRNAERQQELAQRQQELVARAQEIANKTVRVLRLDSMQIKSEEKRLAAMKTFLVDYAHLIGQLQPEEKILITDKSAHMVEFTNSFGVDALKKQ